MTALAKYELLEAPGRYFDGETARPRDVVVKFGDASLIVMNHDDLPITHWSLAGVRDLSSGRGPLSLTPDHDSDERLTVEDPDMIAAIRAFAEAEGILLCPEGAALAAALPRLLDDGAVHRDERVVLFNTATAYKYPEALARALG